MAERTLSQNLRRTFKQVLARKKDSKRPWQDYIFGIPNYATDHDGNNYHGTTKLLLWIIYLCGGYIIFPIFNIIKLFTILPLKLIEKSCEYADSYLKQKWNDPSKKIKWASRAIWAVGFAILYLPAKILRIIVIRPSIDPIDNLEAIKKVCIYKIQNPSLAEFCYVFFGMISIIPPIACAYIPFVGAFIITLNYILNSLTGTIKYLEDWSPSYNPKKLEIEVSKTFMKLANQDDTTSLLARLSNTKTLSKGQPNKKDTTPIIKRAKRNLLWGITSRSYWKELLERTTERPTSQQPTFVIS